MDISELRKIEDLTDNLIGSLAKAESEYKFSEGVFTELCQVLNLSLKLMYKS